MGITLIFSLFALWSLAFPIGKYMLNFSTPIFLTGIRMILAGTILLIYLFLRRQAPKTLSKKQLLALTMLALLSIYFTNILELWGLSKLSASKTCFIYSLSPFIAAILSYLHFNEKITTIKYVGIGIGMIGFLPIILNENNTSNMLFFSLQTIGLPELAIVGAAFLSVYGWVILRIIVKNENVSPLFANGYSMLIGGILALLTSYFTDNWSPIPIVKGSFTELAKSLIFLTLISNIICYNLYGYLLKKYTATILSLFGLMSPIFTSIHSYLLLGENISPKIILSTLVVAFGLFIVYNEELKQGYIQKKVENNL